MNLAYRVVDCRIMFDSMESKIELTFELGDRDVVIGSAMV
jgi:hypothetical protein